MLKIEAKRALGVETHVDPDVYPAAALPDELLRTRRGVVPGRVWFAAQFFQENELLSL